MSAIEEKVRRRLFAMQDQQYQAFQQKLLPSLPPEAVIGVRTPDLRRYARELAGSGEAAAFLAAAPHRYYEENNLHAFVLERERDFSAALAGTEAFLPYIDNWATCDTFSPPVFARHTAELLEPVRRWIGSGQTYTVRYGLGMLMRYYLDGSFRPEYLAWAGAVRSEEYYVRMMAAWYFATALAKQPRETWPWLAEPRLDPWVRAKAVQKALESRRIMPEQKQALRALRGTFTKGL